MKKKIHLQKFDRINIAGLLSLLWYWTAFAELSIFMFIFMLMFSYYYRPAEKGEQNCLL